MTVKGVLDLNISYSTIFILSNLLIREILIVLVINLTQFLGDLAMMLLLDSLKHCILLPISNRQNHYSKYYCKLKEKV